MNRSLASMKDWAFWTRLENMSAQGFNIQLDIKKACPSTTHSELVPHQLLHSMVVPDILRAHLAPPAAAVTNALQAA